MTKYKDRQPTIAGTARIVAMPPSTMSKDQSDRAKAMQSFRDGMAFSIEYAQINAKFQRAKYLALIAEGFDDRQALELCK